MSRFPWIQGPAVWHEGQADPLDGTSVGYRFVQVLDARGDLVAEVQVDEGDTDQETNLAFILAAGRGD